MSEPTFVPASALGTSYRHTILLIEDDDDAVALVRRAVGKVDPNLELVVAQAASDAVDAYLGDGRYGRPEAPAPFLVLFDLKTQDGDSLGVLRQFRADPRMKDAALVVLSASATREQAALLESPESPADAFLLKPITSGQMAQLIARYRTRS